MVGVESESGSESESKKMIEEKKYAQLQRANSRIGDMFMFQEQSFQLRRRNLEAIHLDEFLLAVHDPIPPIRIHDSHVPRFQKPVLVERLPCRALVAPVPHAHVGALDVYFAALSGPDFFPAVVDELYRGVGIDVADAAGAVVAAPRNMQARARHLGHAPGLNHFKLQLLRDVVLQLFRQGRRAAEDVG